MIQAEIRKKALAAPGPIGGALLAAAGVAAVPVLGPIGLAAGAVGLALGAASWWRGASGSRLHDKTVARQAQLLAEIDAARLDSLEHLADDFTYHGLHQGATQARELAAAWRTIAQAVQGRDEIVALELRRLADDGLSEGIRVLESARDARAALESVDQRSLQREVEVWRLERERFESQGPGADDRTAALDQRIDAHERRLALLLEQENAITRLLAEVEKLEGALHEAYLGLVGQGTEAVLNRPEDGAKDLAEAVDLARRVAARVDALDHLAERE